jgi:RNA polymerase sigma-70 factor (ECF subfamily)
MYKIDQYKQKSDDELFLLIQQGNQEAFTFTYQKYTSSLYSLAFRYLKSKDASEDAVQYVFTKLWEFRQNIIVSVCLKNYLFSMAKNYILNYIRDENNALLKNYEILQNNPQYEERIEKNIEIEELYECLQHIISQLPDSKRKIVMMKREGLSNQEIADKMHLSINTVKTHYAQSLKIIKEALAVLYTFVLMLIPFFLKLIIGK